MLPTKCIESIFKTLLNWITFISSPGCRCRLICLVSEAPKPIKCWRIHSGDSSIKSNSACNLFRIDQMIINITKHVLVLPKIEFEQLLQVNNDLLNWRLTVQSDAHQSFHSSFASDVRALGGRQLGNTETSLDTGGLSFSLRSCTPENVLKYVWGLNIRTLFTLS